MQIWKAHYKDKFHDTDVEILNDGVEISFVLDGFKFCCETAINDFEYENAEQSDEIKKKFHVIKQHVDIIYKSGKRIPMYSYTLQRYALDVEIPVNVVRKTDKTEITGIINISFQLVEHDTNKHQGIIMCNGKMVYFDDTIVRNFSLCVDDKCYSSENNTLDFEVALSDICRKMKRDYYIKSCFTCQYSEYSPYGQDDFGTMICYRECKENCLKVNSKNDYFRYLDNENFTQRQETFLCSEYDLRNKYK
ncbi:MAG: hypothetical protein K2I80_07200, partial [Ruminococcus sp.]|nr:hypothetical protein [Ruminococcus sp.]